MTTRTRCGHCRCLRGHIIRVVIDYTGMGLAYSGRLRGHNNDYTYTFRKLRGLLADSKGTIRGKKVLHTQKQ